MKLTWDQFCLICKDAKPNNFKPPDWTKVEINVAATLSVEQDSLLHDKLVQLKTKYNRFIATRNNKGSEQRDTPCTDAVLDSEDFVPLTIQDAEVPVKKRHKKSLDQLGGKQLKNRTDEIWTKVKEYADENNETPLRILALLLKKCKDKNARDLGEHVWQQPASSSTPDHSLLTITVDAGMAVMVDCELGRETYNKLRKTLKQQGHDILPPWINLRTSQTAISPKPQPLPDPHEGVYMPYAQSMEITARRIMETLPPTIVPSSVVMDIKFGFDGSGSHAIYRQVENAKTNNIIMSMFCPLSIKGDSGETIWTQQTPNSAHTHRPLALQLGKESTENLQSMQIFDDDINRVKVDGFTTMAGEKEVAVKGNVASHMLDLKAANLYLGLVGAYCDLCNHSRADCHDPDVVRDGFEITMNVADLQSLFEEVTDNNGVIIKHREEEV